MSEFKDDGTRYFVILKFPNGEERNKTPYGLKLEETAKTLKEYYENFLADDGYINSPSGISFQARSLRVEIEKKKVIPQ